MMQAAEHWQRFVNFTKISPPALYALAAARAGLGKSAIDQRVCAAEVSTHVDTTIDPAYWRCLAEIHGAPKAPVVFHVKDSGDPAYMALALNNSQSELLPIERGLHAFNSPRGVREYVRSIGRDHALIVRERQAAEVVTWVTIDLATVAKMTKQLA